LKLNDEEEQQLQAEIGKLDNEEVRVMELISSYRKKGREEGRIEGKIEGIMEGKMKGIAEGKVEGEIAGKKEAICTFLELKYNETDDLQKKVQAINDLGLLNRVSKEIFAANTLQEVENILKYL
jgi:flagellar biosynthesis/type III secretory pathway protein FliH